MSIESETLRRVMRNWASGVCVVTTLGDRGPHGMTVSSFTSVSLAPPLIVVSLEHGSRTLHMLESSRWFAVGILAEGQQLLAQRFAGAVPDDEDRFDGLEVETLPQGLAVPAGCLAALECRLAASYPAGTHTLVLGEVEAARVDSERLPLLYFDRHYRKLAE